MYLLSLSFFFHKLKICFQMLQIEKQIVGRKFSQATWHEWFKMLQNFNSCCRKNFSNVLKFEDFQICSLGRINCKGSNLGSQNSLRKKLIRFLKPYSYWAKGACTRQLCTHQFYTIVVLICTCFWTFADFFLILKIL